MGYGWFQVSPWPYAPPDSQASSPTLRLVIRRSTLCTWQEFGCHELFVREIPSSAHSERVIEPAGKRAIREVGPVGSATALHLEAEEHAACDSEAVHDVAGAKTYTEIAWMVRVGAQIVLTPSIQRRSVKCCRSATSNPLPSKRRPKSSTSCCLRIAYVCAGVRPIAPEPCSEKRRLIAELGLVGSEQEDTVPHFVVGGADGEPVPLSEDDRSAKRIGPVPVVERERSILNLEAHREWANRFTILDGSFCAAGAGEASVSSGAECAGCKSTENHELVGELGHIVVRGPLLAPREVADGSPDADEPQPRKDGLAALANRRAGVPAGEQDHSIVGNQATDRFSRRPRTGVSSGVSSSCDSLPFVAARCNARFANAQ